MKEVASHTTSQTGSDANAEPEQAKVSASAKERLLRILASEVEQFRPRTRVAQSLGGLLPQFCFNRLRTALWRAAKVSIGEGSLVMGEIILSGQGDWAAQLSIGEHTYITGPLRINLGERVHIGNHVNIGHDCFFVTVNHTIGPSWRRAGLSTHAPIVIEDGAWIASRATILPGVTVGRGAVVAAGAVVAFDVPPHTLVGGVPARVLRKLDSSP